jgi:hypothetical protein
MHMRTAWRRRAHISLRADERVRDVLDATGFEVKQEEREVIEQQMGPSREWPPQPERKMTFGALLEECGHNDEIREAYKDSLHIEVRAAGGARTRVCTGQTGVRALAQPVCCSGWTASFGFQLAVTTWMFLSVHTTQRAPCASI